MKKVMLIFGASLILLIILNFHRSKCTGAHVFLLKYLNETFEPAFSTFGFGDWG